MPSIRPNAIRIKRFRELKLTLRTARDRLLVGIDIAKAQHVAQVRLAHTRILDQHLGVPNTQTGFAAFWAQLQARQRETGTTTMGRRNSTPGEAPGMTGREPPHGVSTSRGGTYLDNQETALSPIMAA